MGIYLDNAATSYPKPEAVYDAMDHFNRRVGATAKRGGFSTVAQSEATLTRCRKLASDLLGVGSPRHVIMTFNCTDSLNTVLHGILNPGDHVVATQLEHNSVIRPLNALRSRGVTTTFVPVDPSHQIEPARIREALRPETRLVVALHASNVTGVIQPIADIGTIAHEHDALMLVDAAQTAGQIPVDMKNLPIDFLAAAGHKGLFGPLGTGILCVRPGLDNEVRSLRQGGTGSESEQSVQPERLPVRFESGSPNMPGIYGLTAALEFLTEKSITEIRSHETSLAGRLRAGLKSINKVKIFCDSVPDHGLVSVVSLHVEGFDPQEVGVILEETFGIHCRAGLHCAPRAHEALGTLKQGGTLRLSPGAFTTEDEIDSVVDAIRQIAES